MSCPADHRNSQIRYLLLLRMTLFIKVTDRGANFIHLCEDTNAHTNKRHGELLAQSRNDPTEQRRLVTWFWACVHESESEWMGAFV